MIEQEIVCALEWEELPGKDTKRISLRRGNTDPTNRQVWTVQHEWLAEKLEAFYKAFAPRIKDLEIEEEQEFDDE